MPGHTSANLQDGREAEIIEMLKALSADDLRRLARQLDRSTMTSTVLCWISAQRSVDLGTAMTMFIGADPARFNHTPKDEVPEAQRRLCASLDALCQRINCGFYLPDPAHPLERTRAFTRWMTAQDDDARLNRKGRWIFHPDTVSPMISDLRGAPRPRRSKPVRADRPGLLRKVISPLMA